MNLRRLVRRLPSPIYRVFDLPLDEAYGDTPSPEGVWRNLQAVDGLLREHLGVRVLPDLNRRGALGRKLYLAVAQGGAG
jgi:hypothetical protein